MKNKSIFFLASAEAFFILMFCTKSSFLYPFNNWTDANCFFTVGKSLLDGKVLYRDIVEQKGLILYLIHSLASLFSVRTFLGVFIMEVIAGAFSLYYLHKIIGLTCGNLSLVLPPACAALIYASSVFSHGGSAEEFCMPMLLCCAYISLRATDADVPLGNKNWFLIGILASLVFWMKYSVCTFFPGLALVPLFLQIRRKKIRPILTAVLSGFAGLMTVTVPVLLYFLSNHALKDMYEIYIYDNIFLYSGKIASAGSSVLPTWMFSAYTGILKNKFLICLLLIGIFWYASLHKWRRSLSVLLMFIFTAIPAFALGKKYFYYYLIVEWFLVFGISAMGEMLLLIFKSDGNIRAGKLFAAFSISLCFSLVLADLCSPNRSFRNVRKEELPQIQFAGIINTIPHATLLNYGFLDYGFYTAAGIVPNTRYFCKLNSSIAGMTQEMDSYLENKDVDFVVTRSRKLKSDNYQLVSTAEDTYEQKHFTYYLYQVIR